MAFVAATSFFLRWREVERVGRGREKVGRKVLGKEKEKEEMREGGKRVRVWGEGERIGRG